MGNQQANLNTFFSVDRSGVSTSINVTGGITYVHEGDVITYRMPEQFGPYNRLRFIPSQEPLNLGGNLFFSIISRDPGNRTVTCAFVDQGGNVQARISTGKYATQYLSTRLYLVSGSLTVTFNNPPEVGIRAIDSFRYIVPTIRTFPSANSTIDNEGTIRYGGQPTINPDLTQVQFESLSDLNNDNSQYMLDINLTNDNGIISMTYNASQCPNIVGVVYDSDNITITTNINIPNISLISKLVDASLGIITQPELYLENVDLNNTKLLVRNSSIGALMVNNGTYMNMSLLILPLAE